MKPSQRSCAHTSATDSDFPGVWNKTTVTVAALCQRVILGVMSPSQQGAGLATSEIHGAMWGRYITQHRGDIRNRAEEIRNAT